MDDVPVLFEVLGESLADFGGFHPLNIREAFGALRLASLYWPFASLYAVGEGVLFGRTLAWSACEDTLTSLYSLVTAPATKAAFRTNYVGVAKLRSARSRARSRPRQADQVGLIDFEEGATTPTSGKR